MSFSGCNAMEDIGNYLEKMERARVILDGRYRECDEGEHLMAGEDINICGHCYRRLVHNDGVYEFLESRSELPLFLQPMDGPLIMQMGRDEIALREFVDWNNGLRRVMAEYNL